MLLLAALLCLCAVAWIILTTFFPKSDRSPSAACAQPESAEVKVHSGRGATVGNTAAPKPAGRVRRERSREKPHQPAFPFSGSSDVLASDASVLSAHTKLLALSRDKLRSGERSGAHSRPSFRILCFLEGRDIAWLSCASRDAWSRFLALDAHALLARSGEGLPKDPLLEQALKLLPLVTRAKQTCDRVSCAAMSLYCRVLTFALRRRRPDYADRLLGLVEGGLQSAPMVSVKGAGVNEQRAARQRVVCLHGAVYRALAHAGMHERAERGVRRALSSSGAVLASLSAETFYAVLYSVQTAPQSRDTGVCVTVPRRRRGRGGGSSSAPAAAAAPAGAAKDDVDELVNGMRISAARRALALAQAAAEADSAANSWTTSGGKSAGKGRRGHGGSRRNAGNGSVASAGAASGVSAPNWGGGGFPGYSPANAPLLELITSTFRAHRLQMLSKSELLRAAASNKVDAVAPALPSVVPSGGGVLPQGEPDGFRGQTHPRARKKEGKASAQPTVVKSRANSDKTDRRSKGAPSLHQQGRSRHKSLQQQQPPREAHSSNAAGAWATPQPAAARGDQQLPFKPRVSLQPTDVRPAVSVSRDPAQARRVTGAGAPAAAWALPVPEAGEPERPTRKPPPGFGPDAILASKGSAVPAESERLATGPTQPYLPKPVPSTVSSAPLANGASIFKGVDGTHGRGSDNIEHHGWGASEGSSRSDRDGNHDLVTLLGELDDGKRRSNSSPVNDGAESSETAVNFNGRFEFGLPLWESGARGGRAAGIVNGRGVGRPTSKSLDAADPDEDLYSELRATAKPFQPFGPSAGADDPEARNDMNDNAEGGDITLLPRLNFDAWTPSSSARGGEPAVASLAETTKATAPTTRSPIRAMREGEDDFLGGALDLSFLN